MIAVDRPDQPVRSRVVQVWATVVAGSAFGPYLVGGVRTEQLVVYLSAVAVVLVGWQAWLRNVPRHGPVPMLLIWTAMTAIATIGAFRPPLNQTTFGAGDLVSGLDNLLLPIAVILLVWQWSMHAPARDIAVAVSRVVVAVMLANTVIVVLAMIEGSYDAMPWLELFWARGDEGGVAVAELALTNGRYTGMFNQPTEAGIFYSLALCCLLYLVQVSGRPRTGRLALGAGGLIVGGAVTVSKVFLLGGIPVLVLLLMLDHRRRRRIALAAAAVVAIVVGLPTSGLSGGWYGIRTITALLDPETAGASTLTAGRLGDGGTLAEVGDQILAHNPWFGLGAAGLKAPYDSTWLEALVTTGIVGMGLVAATLVALIVQWYRGRRTRPRPEHLLGGAVLTVMIAGSIGMPSLTGNRVSTVAWLLLACLVLVTDRQVEEPEPGSGPRLHQLALGRDR